MKLKTETGKFYLVHLYIVIALLIGAIIFSNAVTPAFAELFDQSDLKRVGLPAEIEAPVAPYARIDDVLEEYASPLYDQVYVFYTIPKSLRDYLVDAVGDADEYFTRAFVQMDWSINYQYNWKCSDQDSWSSIDEHGKQMAEISHDRLKESFCAFDGYREPASRIYPEICAPGGEVFYRRFDLKNNALYMRIRFVLVRFRHGEPPVKVYSPWTPVFMVGQERDQAALQKEKDKYEGIGSDSSAGASEDTSISDWAYSDIDRALKMGLVPESLVNSDFRADISRAEFAAVTVRAYKIVKKIMPEPVPKNPFEDCSDIDVLRAYRIGTIRGTSDTTFEPYLYLSREQAAHMLARLYKIFAYPGWTPETDDKFTFEEIDIPKFSDDADISPWAYDSVYLMAGKEILKGGTDYNVMPKARASREQAIIMALRILDAIDAMQEVQDK